MKKATIDLTNCQYLGEFHQRIKEALGFPDGYGENWAAFKDMLTVDCPVNLITVKGYDTINKELYPYVEPMREILEAHKKYWADSDYPFDYEFVD